MFTKNRKIKPFLLCYKVNTQQSTRLLKTINTIDFDNGGFIPPVFINGPKSADGTCAIFSYVEADNAAEAWEQVQTKLTIVAVIWSTEAPADLDLDSLVAHCQTYTDAESIPVPDFDDIDRREVANA